MKINVILYLMFGYNDTLTMLHQPQKGLRIFQITMEKKLDKNGGKKLEKNGQKLDKNYHGKTKTKNYIKSSLIFADQIPKTFRSSR